jgi:hypothetical protein
MESELLYSKERLALERKAQQHLKPVTEDSTGAALVHMRRRLFRAEREARAMRRLTMALFCVSLAGAAGVITMAPPWSEAIESRGSAGQALVRAADAWNPLRIHAGASPAAPRGPAPDGNHVHPLRGYPVHAVPPPNRTLLRPLGPTDSPVPQPGKPSGSLSPVLVRAGDKPEAGSAERSGGKPGRPPQGGRMIETSAGSEGKSLSEPNAGPQVGRGTPAGVRQAGQDRGSSSSRGRGAGAPAELSRSSPHHDQRPAPEQPRGFRRAEARMNHFVVTAPAPGAQGAGTQRSWVGSGSHRTARHSVRWRRRSLPRSGWSSRYLRHTKYWRVLRVSRKGPVNCYLVDPHGNWWKARRVQPGGVNRGDERK